MGTLYLVRHGQASFGADDYDRLSPLGHRQAERLGAYFRERGVAFGAAFTGTLRRHAETFEGIARGMGGGAAPAPSALPGLNEYDSAAVIAAFHTDPLPPADTSDGYRHHFRLLREGLGHWMDGRTAPAGMPTHAVFVEGVVAALDAVRGCQGDVLLVSSGGPISTAVGHVLGTPAATVIELNLRIRNTAVTEFVFNPKRHSLLSFNTLPHLDADEHRDWHTYA
ncbi:histidine phosphatase family protein [uncultured Xylophilus sp.]|uniref:histidine phosphatase family protein n=1 Tax=uncultured Xylophilus sp. TaxID=296832 RepID=UPI0025E77BBF|nr:histidine phosphatase family protein [uncultured Xylophilus sp.]